MGTGRGPGDAEAAGLTTWTVVLLALAMFINYVDRGSLSIAAPALKDGLAISNGRMGLLLSAFFWTYTFAQPLAGSLVQHFDVRKVLAIALGLWAAATTLCGLAGGFAALLGLRLVMGLGESVIYPANARLLAERAPEHRRGRYNGLISMAMCLGPSGGTLVGGLILAQWGWRWVFLSLGLASLLWLIPWLATPMAPARRHAAAPARRGPGYGELLRQRPLWAVSIGQFCYSYQFYLLLTWLPFFLVKAQHVSFAAMAGISAAVYGVQALAALVSGAASDRLIRTGVGAGAVRRAFVLAGVGVGGLSFLMVGMGPHGLMIPFLLACGFCTGFANPMVFAIGQTLSGPSAGGRWMGVQNMVGNLAGITAPMATGLIVDATGSFAGAFFLAGALSVLGLACWGLALGPIAPVAWREEAAAPLQRAAGAVQA